MTNGIKSTGYCGGDNLKKYGLRGDKQRYFCKDLFALLYSFGKEVQRNENQKIYFYSFYGICVILLYGVIYAAENLVYAFMYHI